MYKKARQKKKFYLLWWLDVNARRCREDHWAASCSLQAWEGTSTQQRPVETRHPDHLHYTVQRFQPGLTKHPVTENTTTNGVDFRPPEWRRHNSDISDIYVLRDIQWGWCCGFPEWFVSDKRSWVLKTPQRLLHRSSAPERHQTCIILGEALC